jgi:hypothetical protein
MFSRLWSLKDRIGQNVVPSDTLGTVKIPQSLATVGAGTITATMLISGLVIRTAAGADRTDTTDTAVNIMNALLGNSGSGPEVGEGFECDFSQCSTGGWKSTIAGGTGVTMKASNLSNQVLTDTTRRLLFICTAKGTNTFASGVWTNSGATFDCYFL